MPKIIENVRERAITEARKVLLEQGYDSLTIRKIAGEVGIGLGTFYNYFPSKEYLAASVMLEDWQQMTGLFEEKLSGLPPEEAASGLFDLVRAFSLRYVPAWKEYESHGSSRPMIREYHQTLVDQLSGYLRKVIPAEQQEKEPLLVNFLAETILRFASDNSVEYDSIKPMVEKLLKNE